MLVLSRKKNQSIVIGDNIQIEVLKVSGNTVRIGIAAPQEVKVLRGELAPFGISDEDNAAEELPPRSATTVQEDESGYHVELSWSAIEGALAKADTLSIG